LEVNKLDDLLNQIREINFKRKKVSLSSDLRPIYKISQIAIILKLSCYNNSASILKLQFFNWVFKSKDHFKELENFNKEKFPIIRFDPAVNRALVYAISEDILSVDHSNVKVRLTVKGIRLAEEILNDDLSLVEEKELLRTVKKKVTEAYLEQVFKERYRFDE
jgi:hypothetical protein